MSKLKNTRVIDDINLAIKSIKNVVENILNYENKYSKINEVKQ